MNRLVAYYLIWKYATVCFLMTRLNRLASRLENVLLRMEDDLLNGG